MAKPKIPATVAMALDSLPALAFLGVLLVTRDFQLAAIFVVGGAALSLAVALVWERRIRTLPAVTGGLALVFGGASLIFHRADILQMKMTIVDTLLGGALILGVVMKKNPLKAMLGQAFDLDEPHWNTLAIRYGLFFWACALANEVVRRTQTTHVWGEFRLLVFVGTGLFALSQIPFLMKHAREPSTDGLS